MDTIREVFSSTKVRNKILFTLLALLVFRAATYITIPLINPEQIRQFFAQQGGFIGIVDAFTGSALSNFSIIALGIGPYITASIIIQLLQMDIVPVLKEWTEEGETGKQKINQLTRYSAIGLAFLQALGLTYGFALTGNTIFDIGVEPTFFTYTYLALVMTAGTAFLLWLADQITVKGVGNGTSMIIVAGIIAGLPGMFTSLGQQYIGAPTADIVSYLTFAIVVVLYLLVLIGVTIMTAADRKIPIQYANRPTSSRTTGRQASNIPIKINSSGVIPVIFAVTILSLPQTLISFLPNFTSTAVGLWVNEFFNFQRPLGYAVYAALIIVFTFFYSFIQINPEKIAKNLQQQNAYIPGVRPGLETENYISKLLFKITVVGALYLLVVASLPIFTGIIFNLPAYVQVGGTSLLIVVGVAIQTTQQLKTDLQGQNYSGFIK
jgi:preprotein translocase subunit SecY